LPLTQRSWPLWLYVFPTIIIKHNLYSLWLKVISSLMIKYFRDLLLCSIRYLHGLYWNVGTLQYFLICANSVCVLMARCYLFYFLSFVAVLSVSRLWCLVLGVNDWCLTPNEQFFSYTIARASYIPEDNDDVRFVLDQHA
jgi:hypothetical protein